MIRFSAKLAAPGAALALALSALATPAQADERLIEVRYDAAKVYRIEGKPKVQATIRFADDESIENVAVGDSNAWQITPNKRANLLFVKPLLARANTNMTVVTNKRTYLFDLVASPSGQPMYVLSFKYPDTPTTANGPARLASAPTSPQASAPTGSQANTETGGDAVGTTEPASPSPADPSQLNFAWARFGSENLLPGNVFDDGEATYLSWIEGRAVPAILMTDAKGAEGPVNFTVRGETIVVDGVPAKIVLRSGTEMAVMTNNGPPRPYPQSGAQAALSAQDRR